MHGRIPPPHQFAPRSRNQRESEFYAAISSHPHTPVEAHHGAPAESVDRPRVVRPLSGFRLGGDLN